MNSVLRAPVDLFLCEIDSRSLNELSCKTRTLKNGGDLTVPRNTSHAFMRPAMLRRKIERSGNQEGLRLRINPFLSNILFLTLHLALSSILFSE